jgi:hypothetical protein
MNLWNRLRRLEEGDGGAFDYERWQTERYQESLDAAARLFEAIPASRREAAAKLLGAHMRPCADLLLPCVEIDNPGLNDLLGRICNKSWDPVAMPEALVDCYLNEAKLLPTLLCGACGLLLPKVWGFWVRDEKPDDWWQGPWVPFPDCPGCGEKVYDAGDGAFLPLAATPGWHFRSDIEYLQRAEAKHVK